MGLCPDEWTGFMQILASSGGPAGLAKDAEKKLSGGENDWSNNELALKTVIPGSLQKRRPKECKSQKSWRRAVRCHPLWAQNFRVLDLSKTLCQASAMDRRVTHWALLLPAEPLATDRLGETGIQCLPFWAPVDSSKPTLTQMALVKLSGSQNKKDIMWGRD